MRHLIITISREYGSGGRLIARRLADEMGIVYYDRELIAKVAKQTGFSEEFVQDSERRPSNSFIHDLYLSVQTQSLSDQVFIAQTKVIRQAAEEQSCIFVGRCADYILRDSPNCLKVFVHAPLEERLRRTAEEYGVEERNLEQYVNRQNKARASYYNYFSTSKWGESHGYDLCVNSRIGIPVSVAAIRAAAEGMGQ